MKYLALLVLFTGCATARPTLEDLMRTSYDIGCGEARLVHDPLVGHEDGVKKILRECEEKAKKFDLHQTGIYQDGMELNNHYEANETGK